VEHLSNQRRDGIILPADRRFSSVSLDTPRAYLTRRRLLRGGLAFGLAAFTTPGLFADQLVATPQMTEGPFYPDKLPLDTDNDLIIINDSITPAIGEITHLTGRVLTSSGEPVRSAFVEIWQVDGNGVYLHGQDDRIRDRQDSNFQGYGRFLTDSNGNYYFRTIKPVPYPGRTPHIHFGISRNGHRIYTTQLFIKGEPQNERDGILRSIRDPQSLDTLLVDFKPMKDSKLGELAAKFDIVLGVTARELDDGTLATGIGKPEREQRGRRGRRP
jgi:protocatechuate 3,4-dioxygenase beta subunit